jgi:hypothetical protein
MERTYAAAVFPSTVLGRARNAAAIATACGLALAARHGAALGQHVVARSPAHAPAAITTSPAAATATTAFSGSQPLPALIQTPSPHLLLQQPPPHLQGQPLPALLPIPPPPALQHYPLPHFSRQHPPPALHQALPPPMQPQRPLSH